MSNTNSKIPFENIESVPEAPQRFAKMFSALAHRNFRLFWFGNMISLIGTWMQSVAQGWLVLQITNSPFLLGLVSMVSSLPVLFLSPIGGVLADKLNKHKTIIITQSALLILAFVLATLAISNRVQYWHILVLATSAGLTMAIDAPTRQSFVIELVGKKDLLNAIALNSSIFNLARIVGPALAGLVIGTIGISFCFYSNSLSYLAIIIGLLMMRGNFKPINEKQNSLFKNLSEIFNYARSDQRVIALITLVAAASIFIMPYAMLMPIFARDILKVGAEGLGTLLAAAGIGALIGALTLASLGDYKKKGRLVLVGSIVFVTGTILFSFSTSFHLSLFLLTFIGWGMVAQNASINTLLQTMVPDHLRGRIMSLFVLTFMGMMPFGSFQAGLIANFLGARMALRIGGFVVAIILYVIFTRRKEVFDF